MLLSAIGFGYFANVFYAGITDLDCLHTMSYRSGSVILVLGNAMYMYATYAPHNVIQSKIFLASTGWFIGCVICTVDSFHALSNSWMGFAYVCLLAARICVLFGVQTERCDIFLRDSTTKKYEHNNLGRKLLSRQDP